MVSFLFGLGVGLAIGIIFGSVIVKSINKTKTDLENKVNNSNSSKP